MSYFNQVLLHDFTPLSGPLILNKIFCVSEEPQPVLEDSVILAEDYGGENSDEGYGDEFDESVGKVTMPMCMDYNQLTDRLFFRVFQCRPDGEEILIFD